MTKQEKIIFLVNRKFPEQKKILARGSIHHGQQIDPEVLKIYEQKLLAYREELEAMPSENLATIFDAEQAAYQKELFKRISKDEKRRFFSQPKATANFNHWSKASYWTLDEGVALVLGKEPEFVNWKNIEPFKSRSPFAKRYMRVYDLARRACVAHELQNKNSPKIFLAWARKNEFDIPHELSQLVKVRRGTPPRLEEEYTKPKQLFDQQATNLIKLQKEKDSIQEKLNEITKAPLHESERNSLLKLVYGMAVSAYNYAPGKTRNPATGENRGSIYADLQRVDISLSSDTIRRFLKEAESRFGHQTHSNPKK